MRLNYLYVCAKDLRRAEAWYSDVLLGAPATDRTDRFVFFDVAGFAFGIFDPAVTGEEVRWGTNVVPTFVVDDVDALYGRLANRQVEVVLPLQEVNGTRLFQCLDSEGNLLEFFQWLGPELARV